MDDAGPPSLFVVAYYEPRCGDMEPPIISIIKLDTPELQEQQLRTTEQIKTAEVDEKDIVKIRFNNLPEARRSVRWLISPPTSSSEDLYVVPNWGVSKIKPLEAYKLNLRDGTCQPINPPLTSISVEREGHVVNVGGCIYFLGYYWNKRDGKHSFFQCYDPDKRKWKALQPFPQNVGYIGATAVWGNTILLNLQYYGIWAYDVSKNEWLKVGVEDDRLYSVVGEAVVLGNTIYTLTKESFNLVLGLSIEKKATVVGDLVVLDCSSENLVPGMKPINDVDALDQYTWRRTRHLVHLGKDNFCIVQSCILGRGFKGDQDIKLTYIKVEGNNTMIWDECVYKVKWPFIEQFDVVLCFSLPKCKTTALEEGKSFNLNPFPEALQEEEDSLAIIIDEQLGRSVYVRELPSKVTLFDLAMEMWKFGPIMMDDFQAREIEEGKHRAFVEFESATSKQLAIEASPIMIRDCPVILEQRLKEHTLGDGDRQWSGSSTFGNRGEGSRSQTTCGGDNGGGGVYLPGPSNKVVDLESQFSEFVNVCKKGKEMLENFFKEEERLEQVREQLEQVSKELVSYLEKEKERAEKEMRKVNKMLDFLEQDAEESYDILEEDHVELFGTEDHVELFETEDHVLLFESEQVRRLTVDSDRWRKAAVDMLHSTENNGNLMDRSVSRGSMCCPNSLGRLRRIWSKRLEEIF